MLMCMAELSSRIRIDSRMAFDGKYNSPIFVFAEGNACMPSTAPRQPIAMASFSVSMCTA